MITYFVKIFVQKYTNLKRKLNNLSKSLLIHILHSTLPVADLEFAISAIKIIFYTYR